MNLSARQIRQHITKTLRYFGHFKYSPTFEELHIFLEMPISPKTLKETIMALKSVKKIVEKSGHYTIGEYSRYLDMTVQRQLITNEKKLLATAYIQKVSYLKYIQFIALSGSLSMNNAVKNDDVDLVIVAKKGRMWITRLYCLLVAEAMGVRRKRYVGTAPDKICLNMFFDETDLRVPEAKMNLYVAHEVLQMKSLYDKNNTYKRFLLQNNWVFELFPNAPKYYIQDYKKASKYIKKTTSKAGFFGNILERVARFIQLSLINRHRTNERISDTQLWFFPHDYELKLKKKS